MQPANQEHPLQAALSSHARGTFLAGSDCSHRGANHHWNLLPLQKALTRKIRQVPQQRAYPQGQTSTGRIRRVKSWR